MTEQELDAIAARAEAATPGPWVFAPSSQGSLEHGCVLVGGRLGNGLGDDGLHVGEEEFGVHDAAFIAAARTDVPALVAALREANAKIARMQMRIETVEVECNRHAEATKRVYAELRQANAKIIGLERAYH